MTRPELLRGREGEKASPLSAVFSVLVLIVLLFLLFEMWFLQRFTPVCVDGTSMMMTLESGDWLYADTGDTPERGDIVIVDVREYEDEYGHALFQSGGKPISYIIKRVIALEGDEIYCRGHVVWLKKAGEGEFSRLSEPYAYGSTPDFATYTIGEGEVFLLGDNRQVSYDSTETGPLYLRSVTGVVPGWAVSMKGAITGWENFRERFRGLFQ